MSAARLQQLFTAALFVGALGWVCWGWLTDHLLVGVLVALGVLAGHAVFLAIEFVLVAVAQRVDPAPRATLGQLLRAWWGEVCTAPRVFCWEQPFHAQRHPDFLPAVPGQRGLVLIHGFVCNRGFWNGWMPRLRSLGIPHVAISLEPVFGDIAGHAAAIDEAVRRIEAVTDLPPVIVAHSMGGLAARAWMATTPDADARVKRVLTLGSPHRGTWLARLGWATNTRQMRRDPCPWRHALEAREPAGRFAKFTCFYTHCDNVVFPASTATLPGADNRHVPGCAHVHLLAQPEVFNEVLACVGLTPPTSGQAASALARQDR